MEKFFYNKSLQESFKNVDSSLSLAKEKWNEISLDIKNFKKYLISLDLNQSFNQVYDFYNTSYLLSFHDKRLLCKDINDKLSICKPLIEHKLSVRLQVYECLSDFLLFIKSQVE